MDSLTQLVLGASVGEAVLGKRIGNKAVLWGGIAGTIPDLDVFLNRFYPEIDALFVHRDFSHSIFFPFIVAPLLGYLLTRFYPTVGMKAWTLLFFWSIFTHPLLDLFTGYGTGLLVPFYDYRFQLDTIFIIDPAYTLPLFLSILIILFYKRDTMKRRVFHLTGLVLAHLYLAFTIVNKIQFHKIVNRNISDQGIISQRFMTAPAPLNNFLWWALVETEEEFLVGYYSFYDRSPSIRFQSILKNHNKLESLPDSKDIMTLIRFTKGYYSVENDENGLIFNDLRFGIISGWFDLSNDSIFSFSILNNNNQVDVRRRSVSRNTSREDFNQLITRIKGI